MKMPQVLRWILSPPPVVAATLAILTVRLFVNTANYSLNVLFWDQWDAYLPFFRGMDPVSAFRLQHGVHRIGLVLWLSRWDGVTLSYLMAAVLVSTGVVAVVATGRLFGRIVHTDIALPLLLVSFRPHESIVTVPLSSASLLPLLLLMCIPLLLSCRRPVIRWALLVLAIPALVFTGYGLCVGPVLVALAAGLLVQPRRVLWAVTILGSLLASYAWFLENFRFAPNVPDFQFPYPKPWEYLIFTILMYSNTVALKGLSILALIVGSILILLVFVITISNFY